VLHITIRSDAVDETTVVLPVVLAGDAHDPVAP
jgi:hypothetical protein